MALNFLDPEISMVNNPGDTLAERLSAALPTGNVLPVIETSADVTGIELRMMPPLIKDNRTEPFFPFPGYAKVYCLTIVVSNVENQLVGAIDLKGFPRIDDKEFLPINKSVFYWQAEKPTDKAPNQIHVMCSVMKSKQALRDTGKIMARLKDDEEYTSLLGQLRGLATDAAKFSMVTDIITSIAGVVGKYLGAVEDKPLGTIFNSYTTLYGDFDRVGVSPLTYRTKNVDFEFKMVVRSKKEALSVSGPIAADTPAAEPHEDDLKEERVRMALDLA
jgi:hypothetical protein